MPELDVWLGGEHVATTTNGPTTNAVPSCTRTLLPPSTAAKSPFCRAPCRTPGPTEPAKPAPPRRAPSRRPGPRRDGRTRPQRQTDIRRRTRIRQRRSTVPRRIRPRMRRSSRRPARWTTLRTHAGTYRLLDEDGLIAIVRDYPTILGDTDTDREIRMSLACAQPKFLLARFDDRWYEPVGGAASTHIIKPTNRWANSAYNEHLVMWIAKRLGLTPTDTWVETMGDTTVFVAELLRPHRRRPPAGTAQAPGRHASTLGIRPSKNTRSAARPNRWPDCFEHKRSNQPKRSRKSSGRSRSESSSAMKTATERMLRLPRQHATYQICRRFTIASAPSFIPTWTGNWAPKSAANRTSAKVDDKR